ncbi:unnamed protein product [Pleuronectes platessa]|uniref:Uncharacterized protein n=1 Tax=Pleuronectes platessa TaxID=8262 RepID=A0A9N7YGS6_PLEPL|nr:unnamed protein product [Pleuronectes platessa]
MYAEVISRVANTVHGAIWEPCLKLPAYDRTINSEIHQTICCNIALKKMLWMGSDLVEEMHVWLSDFLHLASYYSVDRNQEEAMEASLPVCLLLPAALALA